MTTKLKMIALSLLGFVSTSIADTTFFNNKAVSITSLTNPFGYKLSINQKGINSTTFDQPVWTFTTAQLPITDKECSAAYSATCYKKEDNDCYHHCLIDDPYIIAFDEKNNKLYFMHGTIMIGTGGGPALLFVADINKKEIKFLHSEWFQEKGTLSPSGRYLVISGNSIMKLYDTQNYNRFELNKTENSYDENNNIRHSLYVKKWLNDTQFTYLDIARHFVRPIPEGGEPFYSAKEATYDIESKKIVSERNITKADADTYEKQL